MTLPIKSNIEQFQKIISNSGFRLSNELPADWAEKNIIMDKKPFPGPLRYDKSPYTREIVNTLSPDHPARVVAVMKGGQIGFSTGVIYAGSMWIIRNNPGNILITVGSAELMDRAMMRIDSFIDNSGTRKYIQSQAKRARAQKTGDTNQMKEFFGGLLAIYNADNHKNIRQDDYMYGFIDDFESIKQSSDKSGSTLELLEQRFAAYGDKKKILLISTPELDATSNIKPAFLSGDQRYFNIPCPVCHEYIVLHWAHDGGGGMVWELDNQGKVIEKSVGYCCPKCAGFFRDNRKHIWVNDGIWIPTAVPDTPYHFSYQISSLYAPVGMDDWFKYVNQYVSANPNSGRIESKYKVFRNVVEGLTYEAPASSFKATSLMQTNVRDYEPGIVPDELSKADGNGEIVMLTCGADMNGVEDDGRLDFEIKAWTESGANYSIYEGSIGTFIPKEGDYVNKADRARFTYRNTVERCIWKEFDAIRNREWDTQSGKKKFRVYLTFLDCGYLDKYALSYIDRSGGKVIGIKGEKEDRMSEFGVDKPKFRLSSFNNKMFLAQVNVYKDDFSDFANLYWDKTAESQPPFFMNFPTPGNGMYTYKNFFAHYEAEERKVIKDPKSLKVSYRWQKKTHASQNHKFDCAIYNLVGADIIVHKTCETRGIKKATWSEFIEITKGVGR